MTHPLPPLLVHSDWSVAPAKRWLVAARLVGGRYVVEAPRPAPDPLARLLDPQTYGGEADHVFLLGFDVPFGLPLAYARQIGCTDFAALLPQLGHGRWADFYRPAAALQEISLTRPFYPSRPGGTRQEHLTRALGVAAIDALRRRCDRPTSTRRAAAPLFWTMGAQQVGKAAITVWRDLIGPALTAASPRIALWPFQGELTPLLAGSRTVVCEAYPAEFYAHLGVSFPRRPGHPSGKRVQAARRDNAAPLRRWAEQHGVGLAPLLSAQIENGFGDDPTAEDRFDALVGALGMVNVVLGNRPDSEPPSADIRRVEGWILGMAAAA